MFWQMSVCLSTGGGGVHGQVQTGDTPARSDGPNGGYPDQIATRGVVGYPNQVQMAEYPSQVLTGEGVPQPGPDGGGVPPPGQDSRVPEVGFLQPGQNGGT